jgi:Family of unknown function (DUF6461)
MLSTEVDTMTGPTASEWDWMPQEYSYGIRLLFVRSRTPEQVLRALGADPASAQWLSAQQALETLNSWVQVGRTGEWAFAIDNSDLGITDYRRIMPALSAGTDLALFETGPNFDRFYYFADGAEVTSFEPLLSHERYGTNPDRFIPQMRQVGLNVDPPPEDDDSDGETRLPLLEMLTLALGIRLTRDVALGPLLTAEPSVA